MRKLLFLTFIGIALISCKDTHESKNSVVVDKTNTEDLAVNLKKVSIDIEGMTCEIGCAKTIESKLSKTEGVTMAKVDFDDKKGVVEFDANKVNTDQIAAVVQKIAGGDLYKVTGTKSIEINSGE